MAGGGSPTLNQDHWQFQQDGANANTSTLIGTEDTTTALDADTVYFLRIKVSNTGTKDQSGSNAWQLQYDKNNALSWADVNGTSSNVRSAAGQDTDGDAMTERLTATSASTYVNGVYDEVDGTFTQNLAQDTDSEHVFSITFRSADLSNGDEIDFRLLASGSTLDNYNVTPTCTVNVSSDTNVNANAASLTLTTLSPSIDYDLRPGAAALSITTYSPSVDYDLRPAAASLSITTYSPSIDYNLSANAAALTITTYAASITTTGDTNIAANAASLSLATYSASVDYDLRPGVSALSITTYSPSIDYDLRPSASALTLTTNPASLTFDVGISANVSALSLSTFAASISLGAGDVSITASASGLILTTYPATIKAKYRFGPQFRGTSLNIPKNHPKLRRLRFR